MNSDLFTVVWPVHTLEHFFLATICYFLTLVIFNQKMASFIRCVSHISFPDSVQTLSYLHYWINTPVSRTTITAERCKQVIPPPLLKHTNKSYFYHCWSTQVCCTSVTAETQTGRNTLTSCWKCLPGLRLVGSQRVVGRQEVQFAIALFEHVDVRKSAGWGHQSLLHAGWVDDVRPLQNSAGNQQTQSLVLGA